MEKLIFVSEYSPNPRIFVLNYDLEEIEIIKNTCELEIEKMHYEPITKYLYIFCMCPEYELKIYNFKKKKIIKLSESINIKEKIIKFEICPFNKNLISILRKKKLQFINLQKSMEIQKSEKLEKILEVIISEYHFDTIYKQNQNGKFTDSAWINAENLYLTNSEGNFQLINYKNLEKRKNVMNLGIKINRVLLNLRYIFILMEKNLLRIYELNENLEILDFEKFSEIEFDFGKIERIIFDVSFTNFLISSDFNELFFTVIPTENYDESEDGKDDDVQSSLNLEMSFKKIGNFHFGKILCLHNYRGTNVFVSVDDMGFIYFWNLGSSIPEKSLKVKTGKLMCAVVDEKNRRLFTGCENGIIRVFDFFEEEMMAKEIFFSKIKRNSPIETIKLSNCTNHIAIKSGTQITILKNDQPSEFPFSGYLNICQNPESAKPSKILDFCFHKINKKTGLLILQNGGLIYNHHLNLEKTPPMHTALAFDENTKTTIRKIDLDIKKIAIEENSEFFYSLGSDFVIKQYKIPKEEKKRFNFKEKTIKSPIKEIIVVDLPCNFFEIKNGNLIFGTVDGNLVIYDIKRRSIVSEYVMSLKNGGVSVIGESTNYGFFLVGGFDGSICFVKKEEFEIDFDLKSFCFKDLEIQSDSEDFEVEERVENIKFYEDINKEKFLESIKDQKKEIQRNLLGELKELQNEYEVLLEENESQDDLKKLDYEEFCIDVEKRKEIEMEERKSIKEIFDLTKKEKCKNELIHQKIKNVTYDEMKTHLKTLTGLEKKLLIMDFPICKIEKKETDYLKKIKFLRKMEMKEKNFLLEKNENEDSFFRYTEILSEKCDYLVNGKSGRPELILNDYEARELEIKEYLEEQKKKMENLKNNNNALRIKKKKFEIKNRRVRKNKKRMIMNSVIKNFDQTNSLKRKSINNRTYDEEDQNEWNYLYSSVEIFSRFKKINQIYFIRNVIKLIKMEFNNKFDSLLKLRDKQIDNINETNKKILEISKKLEISNELFKPLQNIIENEKDILKILDSEIKIKKYLSKEEKRKIEEERKKEEEKLKAINADDSNVRALKMMMGNTLEEKKENILKKEIEKEDWMQKPKEEMTEEERIKYNIYLEKQEILNEEAQKLRKILNQEMKKLRMNIKEIISNFDNKVSILYMKKLEYNYRIYEQELFILKYKRSMYREKLMDQELTLMESEKENLLIIIENFEKKINLIDEEIFRTKDIKKTKEAEHLKMDNPSMNQLLLSLMPSKDKFKKKNGIDLNLVEKIEKIKKIDYLYPFDPYLEDKQIFLTKKYQYDSSIFKNVIIDMLSKKMDKEEDIRKEFKKFVCYLDSKNKLKKIEKKKDRLISIKNEFDNIFEYNNSELDKLEDFSYEETRNNEKIKKNVFVMVRLHNEKIEITTSKVIPLLNDTILIEREEINSLNKKITDFGKKKVDSLTKHLEEKQKVETELIELKILKKEIKESLIESAILTRLKVSKRLQTALNKKDENLIEMEEKNVKKQIEKIISTTEKSIKTVEKKEKTMRKEIKYLKKENKNLLLQGGTLQESVNQRNEIFTMIFNKNPEKIFQEDNQVMKKKRGYFKKDEVGYKKAMELAKNRKYFDIAKKLAHEIENLMIELKTLKERTYPNLD